MGLFVVSQQSDPPPPFPCSSPLYLPLSLNALSLFPAVFELRSEGSILAHMMRVDQVQGIVYFRVVCCFNNAKPSLSFPSSLSLSLSLSFALSLFIFLNLSLSLFFLSLYISLTFFISLSSSLSISLFLFISQSISLSPLSPCNLLCLFFLYF